MVIRMEVWLRKKRENGGRNGDKDMDRNRDVDRNGNKDEDGEVDRGGGGSENRDEDGRR